MDEPYIVIILNKRAFFYELTKAPVKYLTSRRLVDRFYHSWKSHITKKVKLTKIKKTRFNV